MIYTEATVDDVFDEASSFISSELYDRIERFAVELYADTNINVGMMVVLSYICAYMRTYNTEKCIAVKLGVPLNTEKVWQRFVDKVSDRLDFLF